MPPRKFLNFRHSEINSGAFWDAFPAWQGTHTNHGITKYGSTWYIGMDEVLAHYACTFENSDLHFNFNDNPLLTPQNDS